MTAHDWYLENRVAFAIRSLERKEESLFASHLSRCEECRVAVAQLERELAWLPMGVRPVAPPPGLSHALAEHALRPPPRRWRQWVFALAAAATVVVALRIWAGARHEIKQLKSALEARQGRLNAIEDSLSAILGAERVLQKTISGPGYEGGVLIFYDQDTQRWNVVVHDLPAARAGETYQLWYATGGGLLPGPEIHVNGSRPTFLTLPAPRPSDVIGAVLTVGPAGGSAGQPRGVKLARLTF
ncbi:MAG TPA: anti-sigma factor [Gemmatimonadales bacterium]|nr:anti-sigma factor [Gemmatimonadales bacterium]